MNTDKPTARPWTQLALGITAGTIASLGIIGVTSGGFALSFDAIRTVARAAHINTHLDWMLPVTIDGAMAVASVTAIVMKRMGGQPWYPWVVVIANVLISVGCNALHAYQGGGEKPLPGGWAMAVSAIPAVNLALSLHLAIELVMAIMKRGEKPTVPADAADTFAAFAPTVIHGGTHPARPPATQVARTQPAPAFAPITLNRATVGTQYPTQPRTQGEKPAATQPANPAAKPAETVVEKPPAKPVAGAKRLAHPLTADENPSKRALAKAYAKNPAKTNAELAKQAGVSVGTANRYMPEIRAAAVDSANADADEQRAESVLTPLPVADPKPAVTQGVNGHRPATEERSA